MLYYININMTWWARWHAKICNRKFISRSNYVLILNIWRKLCSCNFRISTQGHINIPFLELKCNFYTCFLSLLPRNIKLYAYKIIQHSLVVFKWHLLFNKFTSFRILYSTEYKLICIFKKNTHAVDRFEGVILSKIL